MREVANAVAVAALPVVLPEVPVTLPVTLPVRLPVTFPVNAPVIVPAEKFPLLSRLTIVDAVFAFVAALAVDTAEFIAVCVPVTAPVMFGKVALIVLFSKRMWLSPSPTLSVDVGFVATKPSIYVEVSNAIRVYPVNYLSR